MSAWNGVYEPSEDWDNCAVCGDEHPADVLEDGLCPGCVDLEPEALTNPQEDRHD